MELLDGDVAWVYNMTNAANVEFDVCRFGHDTLARLNIFGAPTSYHSFFPPYAWSMATCGSCSKHLGWAFHESEKTKTPSFAGLILNNLREGKCNNLHSNSEFEENIKDLILEENDELLADEGLHSRDL